jgi:carbon starvation protein CstA
MGVTALLATLAVSAAGTIGTGIYEAVAKPSPPPAPTSAQTAAQQAEAQQAAALAEAQALTARRGMASTILTSPLGVTTQPTVGRATLGA